MAGYNHDWYVNGQLRPIDMANNPINDPSIDPTPIPSFDPPGNPSAVAFGGDPNQIPVPQGIFDINPPAVNMPHNQQPAPNWMRFMPPVVKAGYGTYKLGQRLREMYQNWAANRAANQRAQAPTPDVAGRPDKFNWGYFGQNPGDNPQFVQWSHPTGAGPLTANPSQPGWIGGTPFGSRSATLPQVPGGINWSPGSPGGMLPSTFGAFRGARSPQFRAFLQAAYGMTPHQWELQQRGGVNPQKAVGDYTGRNIKSGE